jgi:hypothetical protein
VNGGGDEFDEYACVLGGWLCVWGGGGGGRAIVGVRAQATISLARTLTTAFFERMTLTGRSPMIVPLYLRPSIAPLCSENSMNANLLAPEGSPWMRINLTSPAVLNTERSVFSVTPAPMFPTYLDELKRDSKAWACERECEWVWV